MSYVEDVEEILRGGTRLERREEEHARTFLQAPECRITNVVISPEAVMLETGRGRLDGRETRLSRVVRPQALAGETGEGESIGRRRCRRLPTTDLGRNVANVSDEALQGRPTRRRGPDPGLVVQAEDFRDCGRRLAVRRSRPRVGAEAQPLCDIRASGEVQDQSGVSSCGQLTRDGIGCGCECRRDRRDHALFRLVDRVGQGGRWSIGAMPGRFVPRQELDVPLRLDRGTVAERQPAHIAVAGRVAEHLTVQRAPTRPPLRRVRVTGRLPARAPLQPARDGSRPPTQIQNGRGRGGGDRRGRSQSCPTHSH